MPCEPDFFSVCATISQPGSFESVLPGPFHQKNYLKASILSPHRIRTLPKMLYVVTWAIPPDSVAADGILRGSLGWPRNRDGQPLRPDSVITAVADTRAHSPYHGRKAESGHALWWLFPVGLCGCLEVLSTWVPIQITELCDPPRGKKRMPHSSRVNGGSVPWGEAETRASRKPSSTSPAL